VAVQFPKTIADTAFVVPLLLVTQFNVPTLV
jgi:hypothetical protein